MSKYDITVSLTPVCPSCGKDLAVGGTVSNVTGHPLERDDPLSRVDRRVFVHSCPDCFVFKPEADAAAKGIQEQRDELLDALEGLYEVAIIDNDKDYARVTNAAAVIAKARGAQ